MNSLPAMKTSHLRISVIILLASIFIFSCEKEELNEKESKKIFTTEISDIEYTTAFCSGKTESEEVALKRGFCWDTTGNPERSNNFTTVSPYGENDFSKKIYKLKPDTKYFVRAFAIFDQDTLYGDIKSFTTRKFETFIDERDSHVYRYAQIGNQYWMVDNVAYLPKVNAPGDGSEVIPKYYVYDYHGTNTQEAKSSENFSTYGVLYNLEAAKTCCPNGWHLPDNDEWKELFNTISAKEPGPGYGAGMVLKSMGIVEEKTGLWKKDEEQFQGVNSLGFSALPAGNRYIDGRFNFINQRAFFGDSNDGHYIISYDNDYVDVYDNMGSSENRGVGVSVRCIKD